MYDVAVVGGGLIGSPAARALGELGRRVALIAPSEPMEPSSHTGVFGAHYDVSRLCWLHHPDPVEEWLVRAAMPVLEDLELRHGGLLRRAPFVFAAANGRDEGMFEFLAQRRLQALDAGRLAERFSGLRFPEDVVGYADDDGPGVLDPRRLVALQQAEAEHHGVAVVSEEAHRITGDGPFVIELASGEHIRAERALVAAGAFSNRSGLLERPLALRFKEESVAVAHVDDRTARRLVGLPAMSYNLDADVAEVYAAPPVRYPDGSWGVKWGANTAADRWVSDIDDMIAWYRQGSTEGAEAIRVEMERHLPTVEPKGWSSHRCVVTYTTHGRPYVGAVDDRDRLFVAVGGNGRSAKSSPAIGRMAAGAMEGDWPSDLPSDAFAPRFADEGFGWVGRSLWSERRAG